MARITVPKVAQPTTSEIEDLPGLEEQLSAMTTIQTVAHIEQTANERQNCILKNEEMD